MKIKILKDTVCDLKKVKPGDVIEASEKDARYLVVKGKAEKYVEPSKPVETPLEKPEPKKKPTLSLKKKADV